MSKIADVAGSFLEHSIPRTLMVGGAMAAAAVAHADPLVDMMSGIKLKPDGTPYSYTNGSSFSFGAQAYGAQDFIGRGRVLESSGMFIKKSGGNGQVTDLQQVRFGLWEGGYTAFAGFPKLEDATQLITLNRSSGDFSIDAPINYGGVDVYRLNLNLSTFSSTLGSMTNGQSYAYAIAPVFGNGVDLTVGGIIVEGNYGPSSWYYNQNVLNPDTMENHFGPEFKYGATYLNDAPVPEPSGLAAVGMGVAALAARSRRRRNED